MKNPVMFWSGVILLVLGMLASADAMVGAGAVVAMIGNCYE